MIRENYVNIFDLNVKEYLCPVNCVGAMGAGLAKAFKDKDPLLFDLYLELCLTDQLHPDFVRVVYTPTFPGGVILFPTKLDFRQNSSVEIIERSLRSMCELIDFGQIEYPAIPKIGAGYGGLDFNHQVRPLIDKYLRDRQIVVELCL